MRLIAYLADTPSLSSPSTNMSNEIISMDVDGTAEVPTNDSSNDAGSAVTLRPFNQTNSKFGDTNVTSDKIDHVMHPLRDINPEHVSVVKLSISESGMDYWRGPFTVVVPCLNTGIAEIDCLSVLRPVKHYCLMDGKHRFQAIQKLAEEQSGAS